MQKKLIEQLIQIQKNSIQKVILKLIFWLWTDFYLPEFI